MEKLIREARRWFEPGEEENWVVMGSVTHADAAMELAQRYTYCGIIETRDSQGSTVFKHFVEPVTTYKVLSYRSDE